MLLPSEKLPASTQSKLFRSLLKTIALSLQLRKGDGHNESQRGLIPPDLDVTFLPHLNRRASNTNYRLHAHPQSTYAHLRHVYAQLSTSSVTVQKTPTLNGRFTKTAK